jgi:hypothetical protein
MITIFKNKKDIPQNMEYVELNDIYFNQNTASMLDDKNQYLIIGRNPKNLFATKENLFELVSEKQGEQTILKLKNYL